MFTTMKHPYSAQDVKINFLALSSEDSHPLLELDQCLFNSLVFIQNSLFISLNIALKKQNKKPFFARCFIEICEYKHYLCSPPLVLKVYLPLVSP